MNVQVMTRACPMCSEPSYLDVDEDGLLRWEGGHYIQDAFPELTAEQRELLMTGFHPKCWDEVFSVS